MQLSGKHLRIYLYCFSRYISKSSLRCLQLDAMAIIEAELIGYEIGDDEIKGWVATRNVFNSVAVIPFWIARLNILIISPTESPPDICPPRITPEHFEKISLTFTFWLLGREAGCLSMVVNSPTVIAKPSSRARASVIPAAAKVFPNIFVEKALMVPLFARTSLN